MTVRLTPDLLRSVYDMLSETNPFKKWNLPPGEDVEFRVVADKSVYGWCNRIDGKYVIAISKATVGYLSTLITTMAHEKVHLHEMHCGVRKTSDHDRVFKRFAAQVFKVHGFDPAAF